MSGKPKYIQIEDSILNQIKGGNLRPGDQIPTEAELCDTFMVSRMTVNKAIQSLASKGYINRVAGKGSFVTNVHIQKPIVKIPQSFSEDMRSIGLTPGSRLVDYRIYRGSELPEAAAQALNVARDDMVHYFSRIRTGNDMIICISYTYVPCRVLPAIDVTRLEHSFFEYVKELWLNVQSMDLSLTATLPTEEQKRLLGIENEALLKSFHNTYLDNGDILEYIETYYIGSMYTYRVTL